MWSSGGDSWISDVNVDKGILIVELNAGPRRTTRSGYHRMAGRIGKVGLHEFRNRNFRNVIYGLDR